MTAYIFNDISTNWIITANTIQPKSGDILTVNGDLTVNGSLSGNTTTAINIAGGLGGQIPYQSAVNTTALLANGTAGQYLKSQGTTLPPVWDTPAGGGSNATTIDTTDTNASGTYYPTFVSASGSTQTLRVDTTPTPLSYNPSTGALTTTSFVGDLSGNATSATNATNAINCSTTSTTTAGTYYPVFVSNNVSGNYPNLVGVMTYNPSTNTITANTFNGVLSGTATNATNAVIGTDNASTLVYPTFVKTSGAGNKGLFIDDTTTPLSYNPSTGALTTTSFVGDLSGNATSATNATNAINCSTTSTTTAGTYYPVFVSNNVSGNYPNLVGVMTYNPSTNTITANTFNGVLSGTATNATNVGITSDNTAGTYYIPFAKTSGTGNKPLFIDDTTTPLSYNPNTGVLTAVSYAGSGASLTGITATTATNATNVGITDTTTTAGTYYPTFVSANTGNVPLRTDSQYLQYNPNTNIFQNPNFLVSNGTETSSTGGLLISTGGVGSKSITSTNSTGATNNALCITTQNSGNANSGIYDYRFAGSGNGSGSGITANPSWSLYSYPLTPTSPAGTPYSSGNYYMVGSCCNMATQLTPNGSESGVVVGFQNSIGDNNGYADMFYNPDQYGGTSPYILRLDGNGNLKYGIGTAGTYSFGTPNPSLSSTYFSVNNSGVLSFGGDTYGIQNQTTTTQISVANPLTFTAPASNLTFDNYYIEYFGTGTTITSYSFTNLPYNCDYTIAVYNGGASGNLVFSSSASYKVRSSASSTSFTIGFGKYGTIRVQKLRINSSDVFFLSGTLFG